MHDPTSLIEPAARSRRGALSRLAGVTAAAALASAAILWGASPALAHDELVGTQFELSEEDGQIDAVVLSYSAVILDVGTEIIVTGPDGTDATEGEPEPDGRDVRQPLAGDLPEGTYDFTWRVVSSDGHPIEGAFSFEVSYEPGYEPSVLPFSQAADDAAENDTEGEHSDAHDHDLENDAVTEADAASDEGGFPVGLTLGIVAAVVIVGALAIMLAKRRSSATRERADDENSASPDAPRSEM